jgi:hypothetical protein
VAATAATTADAADAADASTGTAGTAGTATAARAACHRIEFFFGDLVIGDVVVVVIPIALRHDAPPQ